MKVVKLPNVTGYLIMGLIAGPYVLNIIPADMVENLSIIPSVALGFIALSIGAEFKLSYLKKVGKELKLVKWPTAKEVIKYTISTIIFCAFLCLIFMALNLIMSLIRGWVA